MKQTPRHKLYNVAETLFVDQGFACKAIAEQLELTEATLSKWRNQMEWDNKREAVLSSPEKIRKILLTELQSVTEGNKSKIDTDALSKISKALQYFDGKVTLSIIISVFKEFDNWMCEIDPQMAVKFTEYHRMFANYHAQMDSLR